MFSVGVSFPLTPADWSSHPLSAVGFSTVHSKRKLIHLYYCPPKGRADPATILSHLHFISLCSQASPVSSQHPQGCCVFSSSVPAQLIITLALFHQEVAPEWFHSQLATLSPNAVCPWGQNSLFLWTSLPPMVPPPTPKP